MRSTTLVLLALLGLAIGDVYMHNMRGSNNRLNEANTNRDNNNRLFDSQNNAKGGYCYGPAMSYYEGSQLTLEWTSQHGCGSDKLHCQIILQYMCSQYNNPADTADNTIRDGDTTTTPPATTADDAATPADNPDDSTDGMGYKYGQHENFYYYQWCRTRERNKGLYTADRNVNNGAGAAATRQNNNGGQSGYECPEERDYYPYWHPAPWKDIAILTDDTSLCGYFQSESQNVKAKGYCYDPNAADDAKNNYQWSQYSTQTSCTQNKMSWAMYPAWGISKPDCIQTFFQRDNHLGNVGGNNGYNAYYNWTLPTKSDEPCAKNNNCNCVLRLRYNISSNDFSGYTAPFADASNNAANSFLKQDPDLPAVTDSCADGDGTTPCNVTLAIDTSQFARTFQDRSFVWHLLKRPSKILSTSRIFNLNVKGKRGNIVQAYPATEYDFHPNDLQVRVGDYIHFQWTGCNNNPAGSAGEGKDGTDRTNIVQIENLGANKPASEAYLKKNPMFESSSLRYRMAFLDQGNCSAYDANANDQADDNCMILNAADRHFDGGAVQMNKTGTFYYMNSRNNNFTNRGQKGSITVSLLLPTWGIVMVSIGSALFAGSAGTAGAMIYAKSHPDSKIADLLSKF